jgi:aryl-alcohol dehydrogenase-like predicted oxidoreductase
VEYVTFGNTGRKVSRLGYGGAVLGLKNYLHDYDPANPAHRAESIAGIHRALELGVNYFDTAPGYGDGQSEAILGEALKGRDMSELFLATKIGPRFAKGEALRSVEGSLARLGVPALDLIQLHGNSYTREDVQDILGPGGRIEELLELKRQGLVRHVGFTTEDNNAGVYDFIEDGRFDMLQICYNLLFQHPYDPNRPFGSLFEAKKAGMGISIMRPTTSGLFQKWIRMVDPDNTHDYTPDLLRFAFSNPLIDVVLVGMRSAARVEQNVALVNDIENRIDIMDLYRYYV